MHVNLKRIFLAVLTGIVFLTYSSCSKDALDDPEILQATKATASTSTTVTLAPIHDAYLKYDGNSYDSSLVRLDNDQREGYFMFDLSGISWRNHLGQIFNLRLVRMPETEQSRHIWAVALVGPKRAYQTAINHRQGLYWEVSIKPSKLVPPKTLH